MFKWVLGRQNPYYQKTQLCGGKKWDCYLIRYDVGCFIGWHLDPVKKGYKHYRLNILLRGEDKCEFMPGKKPIWKWWRFCLFRPDIVEHGLGMIRKERLLLSIGWIRKDE